MYAVQWSPVVMISSAMVSPLSAGGRWAPVPSRFCPGHRCVQDEFLGHDQHIGSSPSSLTTRRSVLLWTSLCTTASRSQHGKTIGDATCEAYAPDIPHVPLSVPMSCDSI